MNHKRLYIVWMILLFILTLSACTSNKNTSLEPSKLFYIHDQDHILLNATSWTIFNYANELYLDSKADDIPSNIQGAQVVVVAYIGDESTYNTTEIFNNWGIGENDMGILITVLFSKEDDTINYENILFEIGTTMSGYLSAFSANQLITDYFNDPLIPEYDYDARIISLFHGVLSYIYLNIYDYTSYNHTSYMDAYYEVQYDYIAAIPKYEFYEGWFSSYWFWIIFAVIILSGGSIYRFLPIFFFSSRRGNSGGGGKSIGYWFKR